MTFGTRTYTWQHGRQLAQTSKDGETVSFVYNEDGLRVQKTATSTGITKYILHGKNIVHLTNGNDELHFFYDAQGKVAVVDYNGTPYRYVHNLQGDVVALVDGNGDKVVEYWYDAWGKPTVKTGSMAETLGTVQPFRYRGYVFDEETGLYYLRSRYYSPYVLRHLATDTVISKIGDNATLSTYSYARNSPAVRADSDGDDSYYVIYDSRTNGKNKGLRTQGHWAINYLRSRGDEAIGAGFRSIPGFIRQWNKAKKHNFDYIVIYAHGSAGTIDCNGSYLQDTDQEGFVNNDYYCYSSNRLEDITVNKGIILLSCNAATPDGKYRTAIGMLSSKAGGVTTEGSAYASINYIDGTGIPYQGPGVNANNGLFRNALNILYWCFSACWVSFSYDGMNIRNRPSFP